MAKFTSKDLTGQRHEMVVAVAATDKKAPDGSIIWTMQCDCGTRFERAASRFTRQKSCGCKTKNNSGQMQVLDLTGFQGKGSVALRPTNKRSHTYTVWVMRCLECGDEFETAAYNITKGVAAHRCPAWNAKYRPHIGRTPIPNSGAHVNALYANYRQAAKNRQLSFELTKEEARHLFEQPCHYCGAPPALRYNNPNLHGSYAWNGIDRVDSAIGYTVANCVPCCSICNFAKRDMAVTDFLDWVQRLARHQGYR